jgi:Tol biopolymer transport system component
MKKHLIFPLLFFFVSAAYAQTVQTTYGKNRVQYHSKAEEWMYYETEHFTTYWYGDARSIAEATVLMAEQEYPKVRRMVDYALNDRIELFVFTDLTDLKQSNVGIEEIFLIQRGETKVIGTKAFVYFDGNHQHLKRQLREATSGVMLNAVLFGRNFQEIIQNAVLLNLPEWFTMGIMAYCGEEWSVERDNQLKDILLSGQYKDFNKLARDYPRLAGHAFWYYFGLYYGSTQINSVINILATEREADNSFRYVTGVGQKAHISGAMTYFMQRYKSDVATQIKQNDSDEIKFRNKKCREMTQVQLSPDGERLAYVLNENGRWSLYTQTVRGTKRTRLMRRGNRNALQDPDLNYPIVTWSPDNTTLAVIWEQRDVIQCTLVDTKTGKKTTEPFTTEYQRIYSAAFVNPGQIAVSAAVQGYSDIFIYTAQTRNTERITQDFWDDLDVSVGELNGEKRLYFASNRPTDTLLRAKIDTILPIANFDLFAYNLTTQSPELQRLTNTPQVDERQPAQLDSSHFTYLNNLNGHFNRDAGYLEPYFAFRLRQIFLSTGLNAQGYDPRGGGAWEASRVLALYPHMDTVMAMTDSTQIDSINTLDVYKYKSVTYHQTNLDRDVMVHATAPRVGMQVELMRRYCSQKLYLAPIDINQTVSQVPFTRFRQLTSPYWTPQDAVISNAITGTEKKDTVAQVLDAWLFQVPERLKGRVNTATPAVPLVPAVPTTGISVPNEITEVQILDNQFIPSSDQSTINRFNPSRIIPYRLQFRTDYVKTKLDNSLLFEGLESFAGSPQGFKPPTPGILTKGNFKELLENHTLELGLRVPVLFNGAEYYAILDQRQKRIDRRFAVYRKSVVNTIGETGGFGTAPIRLRSNTVIGQYELRYPFDAFMSLRGTATLRQDRSVVQSLNAPTLERASTNQQRAAARVSFVYDDAIEIDENIRYGLRAKVSAEVIKRFALNTRPDLNFSLNEGFMSVLSIDTRYYWRLDKRSILATRVHAGTSFGAEQILYYLGGVDNWLFPEFQNNIPIAQNRNYAFEAQATNLRGFSQNIRNGNSFALINTELRVPFAQYLSRKPKLRSFWRNLQLIGFIDAGSAWSGLTPYSGNNPLNTQTFSTPPAVSVTVNYFRDPLVVGYGGGVRAKLLGTFLRLDYGRGIETRRLQPGRWYLAMGTDF